MTKEEAFALGLPKWPQMVINGDKITEEQALEIIRRTDSAFYCEHIFGNNHDFVHKAESILNKPKYPDYGEGFFSHYDEYREKLEEWQHKWGIVQDLCYMCNDWVSCAWIGGAHGWCHPDGTIAYRNNIGKYPEVEEVYNELVIVAKEFPFLNFTCTLMNGEEDFATESIVSMQVANGEVEFIDTIPIGELEFNGVPCNFDGRAKENYFSLEQIQNWVDMIFNDEKRSEKYD